jgi:hypothetical protein
MIKYADGSPAGSYGRKALLHILHALVHPLSAGIQRLSNHRFNLLLDVLRAAWNLRIDRINLSPYHRTYI